MIVRFQHLKKIPRLVSTLLAILLLLAFTSPSWTNAQSASEDWQAPFNLSHSGVAMNPAVVADSDANIHAIWQDELANFYHARLEGNEWSASSATELNLLFDMPALDAPQALSPAAIYSGPNPLFIAGPNQEILAFWLSDEAVLYASQVKNQNVPDVASWAGRNPIAAGVASFSVALDARGEIHLVFVRTSPDPVDPPGIYYTRSKNSGRAWGTPALLFQTPYFRTLTKGEANVSIAATGTVEAVRVFVVWDNRPRKQIFLTQTDDGGETWAQPTLIGGPTPGSGSVGPFNIQVGVVQEDVLLIWQSGRPGGACTQFYQSSGDAGATWKDPQPMIEGLIGCIRPNQFIVESASTSKALLYLLTETQDQVYLSAWNGLQWSLPQAQAALAGFEEPEIYTEVIYGCRQAAITKNQLYVIGCDQGGGGDVWVTSRDLGTDASWFEPPVWSRLAPITNDSLELKALKLVATQDGLIHAFFSQHADSSIYYTFWNGELWSRIIPVLTVPRAETGQPEISTGPDNELFLVTINSSGSLYFSRAASGNAASESRWSNPTRIELTHDGDVGSAKVARDSAGTLFLAYSVPVNEERGIYLIQSKDNGKSWSEPLQVFDGAAAGFDLVGAPSMLIMEPASIHLTWEQLTLQGDGISQPFAIYYARSEDHGNSFSDAEAVVKEQVDWQSILADEKGNLHLLWQTHNLVPTVWDQVSLDNGRTWQLPQGLPTKGMATALMVDSLNRLHFVEAGTSSLDHWRWTDNRWEQQTSLPWSLTPDQSVPLLAIASNAKGSMMIALEKQTESGDRIERILDFSTRKLSLASEEPGNNGAATQTMAAPTLPIPSPTLNSQPALTATIDAQPTDSQSTTGQDEAGNQFSPYLIAMVPVALLLLTVLAIVIRRTANNKDA